MKHSIKQRWLHLKQWLTPARFAFLLASGALAMTTACSNNSSDNNPTVTGISLSGGAYGVGNGGAVTVLVQDPSNNNAVVSLLAPITNPPTWGNAQTVGYRVYDAQGWADAQTGEIVILTGWGPAGSNTPQNTRGQLFKQSGGQGVFTQSGSTGSGNWTSVLQVLSQLNAQ